MQSLRFYLRYPAVEAFHFPGGEEAAREIVDWLTALGRDAEYRPERTHDTAWDEAGTRHSLPRSIPAPEKISVVSDTGYVHVLAGHWILRDGAGRIFSVDSRVFSETYVAHSD